VTPFMQSVRCRVCLEDVESSAFSMLPRNGWYNEVEMNESDIKLQEGFDAQLHTYDDVRQHEEERAKATGENLMKCHQHSMEELRYFCYSCEESICSECLIENHRKHELGKVEECCDKYRAKLALMEFKVQEKAKSINESLNQVLSLQQSLSNNANSAKQIVQSKIGELRAKLDLAEVEMMLSIEKEVNRKVFLLKRQEEELKLVIEKFITASSFVNNTVSYANDVEVTLMRKVVEERMNVLDEMDIQTRPECNDKINQEDLELKLNSILAD